MEDVPVVVPGVREGYVGGARPRAQGGKTFPIWKYREVKRIGGGTFGSVYLYEIRVEYAHEDLPKRVAVKKIKPERFSTREEDILSRLKHENVVKYLGRGVFKGGRERGRIRLVMELCDTDLYGLVKCRRHLSQSDYFHLARQMLLALAYIHQSGCIHRDFKPANVLLCHKEPGRHLDVERDPITDMCIKVTDFGLSRDMPLDTKTLSGKVGTYFFMAPEVSSGDGRYKESADLYSFALTLFYLMDADTGYLESMNKYQATFTRFNSLSTDAQTSLDSCLAHDPLERPSASALLRKSCFSDKGAEAFQLLSNDRADMTSSFADGKKCKRSGQFKEAIKNYENCLEILKETVQTNDENRRFVAKVLKEIASCYWSLRKYPKALRFNMECLDEQKIIFGTEANNEMATTMNDLAFCFQNMEKYDKALEYHHKTLDMDRKLLGEDVIHMNLVKSLKNIGACHDRLGYYYEAVGYYDQSLKMQKALLKEGESPDLEIASTLRNKATCHFHLKDYDMAFESYKQELRIQRTAHNRDNHVDIVFVLHKVGHCLRSLEKYQEAIEYYDESVRRNRHLGHRGDRGLLAVTLNDLSICFQCTGQLKKALSCQKENLKIQQELYGEDGRSRTLAKAHSNVAWCLKHLGQHGKALPHYRKAQGILQALYGSQDRTLLRVQGHIKACHNALKKFTNVLFSASKR